MSHYKLKLTDKAAFLNHMEKQGIHVDSFDIKDNKFDGTFEFDVNDDETNDIVKKVLQQSPKINKMKENKMTKTQLAQIVREELQNSRPATAKAPVNEDLLNDLMPILGTILGVGGTFAVMFYNALKGKSKEEKEQILKQISSQISNSKGQGGSTY
jgi:hypothetical protein